MMLYPFMLALTLGIAAWIASWIMQKRWPATPPSLKITVLTLLACYLAGWAIVLWDPSFEDNGLIETIPWSDRWAWAGEYAGWLAIIAFPLVLLGRSFWPDEGD